MSEAGQTRVAAVLDDMFFASKIREAAKQAGVNVTFHKKAGGLIKDLTSAPPTLIIFDLNCKKLAPLELIREINEHSELKNIPTLGYLPHVEEELGKEALRSGFDRALPRSRFVRELVSILGEYSS